MSEFLSIIENNLLIGTDQEVLPSLNQALLQAQEQLTLFASDIEFVTKMKLAFGENIDVSEVRNDWLTENFSVFANIRIISGADLQGSLGAYAQETDTIYLSSEFLVANANNVETITGLLLEEAGHRVDAWLNGSDTFGDEGEIFSALARGESFSEAEWQRVTVENDSANINLDGQSIQIEQNVGEVGTTYFVSTTGVDSEDRDGLSWETAWNSLAYASERVPEGVNTIQLGAGTFVATETARPKSGVTIAGMGRQGDNRTQIIASTDWQLSENPLQASDVRSEYLIAIDNANNIIIRDLVLSSESRHQITGAVHVSGSEDISIHDLTVRDFRWAGLHLQLSSGLDIYNNSIENASYENFGYNNGLITTRWIEHSEIHHNNIVKTKGAGFGYKGGGHENVRIHHNIFNLPFGFAIESAHENEYGVEIDHNFINQTISIPKVGQGADPSKRGYDYSFWIHDNLLTDSHTIEGPRNHLRFSHNYVHIDETGGNVYTQHGGINNGPVWLHHNVIENVDRGLVWIGRGLAEEISVYNNTVTLADTGSRPGAILSAPNRDSLNNWVARNNIFIAPQSQPRNLFWTSMGDKITATDNIVVNVTNVPGGNYLDVEPGFRGNGDRPWPFYAPATADSLMVDRGAEVGLPFLGEAPDIGAYELGAERPFPISVAVLNLKTLVNGVETNNRDAAVQVRPGEIVIWTYEVTNNGTTNFNTNDVTVTDYGSGNPDLDVTSDVGGDGLLSPRETWSYQTNTPVENLITSSDFELFYQDSQLFYKNVGTIIAPGSLDNTVGTLAPSEITASDGGLITLNSVHPPIRIDVGGNGFTGVNGDVWAADYGFQGGETYYRVQEIANTNNDEIFYGRRYGDNISYDIDLSNGIYNVVLHMMEPNVGAIVGSRVFDVYAENELRLDDFDMYVALNTQAAPKTAVTTIISNVAVVDGVLDLDFSKVAGRPVNFAGIEIFSVDSMPTAISDSVTVIDNSNSNQIDVLANDTSFGDGLALLSANTTSNNGGNITIDDRDTTDPTDDVIRYTPAQDFSGTDTFSYTLTDINGDTDTSEVEVMVSSAPLGDSTIRIDVGGNGFTDIYGNVWSADYGFQGGTTHYQVQGIANTDNDELFYAKRYGTNISYDIPLVNGTYDVVLHMMEPRSTAEVGTRVFDVFAENELKLDDFDMYVALGANAAPKTAVTATLNGVTVTDGALDLDLTTVAGLPVNFAGIEAFLTNTYTE